MTKTETAELQELNMSPDALEERAAKVSEMLKGSAPVENISKDGTITYAKPLRKRPGPKPKQPTPQAPGTLTPEQVTQIQRLYAIESLAQETYVQARLELVILADKAELAHQAAVAYLETLAKGGA